MEETLEQFKAGAVKVGPAKRGRKFPRELQVIGARYALERRAAGCPWQTIASELDVGVLTIRRWCEEHLNHASGSNESRSSTTADAKTTSRASATCESKGSGSRRLWRLQRLFHDRFDAPSAGTRIRRAGRHAQVVRYAHRARAGRDEAGTDKRRVVSLRQSKSHSRESAVLRRHWRVSLCKATRARTLRHALGTRRARRPDVDDE